MCRKYENMYNNIRKKANEEMTNIIQNKKRNDENMKEGRLKAMCQCNGVIEEKVIEKWPM